MSVGDGQLTVRYQRIDIRSPAITAVTVPRTLGGYDGPSWARRMHDRAGCWKVTGRVGDITLTFVVEVERG